MPQATVPEIRARFDEWLTTTAQKYRPGWSLEHLMDLAAATPALLTAYVYFDIAADAVLIGEQHDMQEVEARARALCAAWLATLKTPEKP